MLAAMPTVARTHAAANQMHGSLLVAHLVEAGASTIASTTPPMQHPAHPVTEALMPRRMMHVMRYFGMLADSCDVDQAERAHGDLSSS